MTARTGVITGFSVAHGHADLDAIELACATQDTSIVESLLEQPSVTEAVCLQTCNRSESYVVTESPDSGREALQSVVSVPSDAIHELGHEESLRHLMRVSCGLESIVLGEDQILGQLREAYLTARSMGAIGPMLEEALTKALHVGEQARTETAINEGIVSLGSAAVRLAAQNIELADASALVVGAGEMGTIAASSLATEVDRTVIANRTVVHAEHVADSLDGGTASAISLDELPDALSESDVVVSATGSNETVIDSAMLAGTGTTLLIDIAQPRDIAPDVDERSGVTLCDLAALESITDRTTANRRAAAEAVETMIDEEVDRLLTQYKRKRADEVIAAMYEGAETVKQRELSTAFSKLEAAGDLTDEQRDAVESLADALVGQLLAAPTKSLRDAAECDDWSTINTALQLFNPHFDESNSLTLSQLQSSPLQPQAQPQSQSRPQTAHDRGNEGTETHATNGTNNTACASQSVVEQDDD